MTASATWTDWSCQVRVTVTDAAMLDRARHLVMDLMGDVERAASRFLETSDVSRVNAGAGRLVPVSGRTTALVDVALDAAARTEGLVDPTIGRHVIEAGYRDDISLVRDQLVDIGDGGPPARADWRCVKVDHELVRIGVPEGLSLDLGATAKPWTADTTAHTIAAFLGTGVLVEIGGDIAVAGRRTTPWQVLVSERDGDPGEQVGLTAGGLATSSTSARKWHTQTGPAHHIIDPRTGASAHGPWRTATVWARSAVDANMASTAAIILGHEAEAFLHELNLPSRLVDHRGAVHTVGAWPALEQVAS